MHDASDTTQLHSTRASGARAPTPIECPVLEESLPPRGRVSVGELSCSLTPLEKAEVLQAPAADMR